MPTTLKDLPIDIAVKKPAKKSDVPVCVLPPRADQAVALYNAAADKLKAAKAEMAELEGHLLEQGLKFVVENNVENAANPKAQIASVKLQDPAEDGIEQVGEPEQVMFTMANQYLKFDKEQAEAGLNAIKTTRGGKPVNVADYIDWNIVAAFDTEVFYANGKFSLDRYVGFMKAVAAMAKKFGVECPLSCSKEPVVKDDFHARRLSDFGVAANVKLQQVLPAKLSLKPVRSSK